MPKPTFFNLPEAKRQRLTELAIEEFSSHSYRQASISNIVARAGIAKGSLYQYFEDKHELFRWLLLDVATNRKRAYQQGSLPTHEMDYFSTLKALCLSGMRFYQEEPRMARLSASVLEAITDPEVASICAAQRAEQQRETVELLEQAKQRGQLPAHLDTDIAGHIVLAVLADGLTSVLLSRLNVDLQTALANPSLISHLPPDELDQIVEQVVQILRRGLACASQPG